MGPKRIPRYLVGVAMEMPDGVMRRFWTRPLSLEAAERLERAYRLAGRTDVIIEARNYTPERLERAEELADAGKDVYDV